MCHYQLDFHQHDVGQLVRLASLIILAVSNTSTFSSAHFFYLAQCFNPSALQIYKLVVGNSRTNTFHVRWIPCEDVLVFLEVSSELTLKRTRSEDQVYIVFTGFQSWIMAVSLTGAYRTSNLSFMSENQFRYQLRESLSIFFGAWCTWVRAPSFLP